MSVVLREVIPDGSQWGQLGEILADWSDLEFGQDVKSAGSISFTYPTEGANVNRLRNGMYVTAVVDGNYQYKDSYFFVRERTGSSLQDSRHTTQFSGISLKDRLSKVRWMPAIGSVYMDSGSFKYTNVTPEALIRAGVENYWSRAKSQYKDQTDWLVDVKAAPGTKWSLKVDESIDPPMSVMDIISKYQDLGLCSAWFSGFSLMVSHYAWDSNQNDKTGTVRLSEGVNLIEGTYSESMSEIVTALLVVGAQNPLVEKSSTSSSTDTSKSNSVQWVFAPQAVIDKWGYREDTFEVSDAWVPDTLKAIGQNKIKRIMEPRYSKSYTMVDHLYDNRTGKEYSSPTALVDFQSGDLISITDTDGTHTERVFAISLSYRDTATSPSISLTLNDFFESWEITFDQRLRRLGM